MIERFQEIGIPWIVSRFNQIKAMFRLKQLREEQIRRKSIQMGIPIPERRKSTLSDMIQPMLKSEKSLKPILKTTMINAKSTNLTSDASVKSDSTKSKNETANDSVLPIYQNHKKVALPLNGNTQDQINSLTSVNTNLNSTNSVNTNVTYSSSNMNSFSKSPLSISSNVNDNIPPTMPISMMNSSIKDKASINTYSEESNASNIMKTEYTLSLGPNTVETSPSPIVEKRRLSLMFAPIVITNTVTPLGDTSLDEYISEIPDQNLTRLPQYYRDDKLNEFGGIGDEFSQKIIQFGFVSLFACTFPLAPVFALINNIYEL